ncbi:MAG TPA: hypothetical protein VL241_12540 [Gemmatimonadales bacterium]|jgi:hypothetical protein|nr:hypothetical protein [Gemmatimonadales bacterium]
MTEEELLQSAAKLGEDAVSGLDEQRVARTVLERLASEPVAAPRRVGSTVRWLAGVAAVAAAVLLMVKPPTTPTSPSPLSPPSVLHELDDLSASELQLLLESMPASAAAPAHPDPGSLDELDTKNLERLLRSLEG